MTDHYDYIDIDPANPPQLPCDVLFTDKTEKEWSEDKWTNGILTEIHITEDGLRFKGIVLGSVLIWERCKLRIEKKWEPDDTVKRLWWYDFNGSPVLSSVAFVESEIQSRINGVTKYAPGPEVPPAESWRTV